MGNRRKYQRHAVANIAHITPHGLQQSAEVQVRDISTHGLGGYVSQAYQKGDILLIKLSLPVSKTEAIQESLMGQISWITQVPEEEQQYAFGVAFCEIKKQKPLLYAYLKQIETQNIEVMSDLDANASA